MYWNFSNVEWLWRSIPCQETLGNVCFGVSRHPPQMDQSVVPRPNIFPNLPFQSPTTQNFRTDPRLKQLSAPPIHFYSSPSCLALNPTHGILLLSAKLLQTTLILLAAIAKLAQTGSSLTCLPLLMTGYNTPAATGKAIKL